MSESDDHQLLAEFARTASEPAFAAIVARYLNLVFSTAFRCTGNAHHAEEITQAVFIILARKAGQLPPRVVLSGWLYQTTRLTAANFVKGEIRRRRREQEAYMQSTLNEPTNAAWQEIAPLLDEAMGRLGQTDRDAVVLRFFENKSSAQIGTALRMNEETARRRVNRALEKLRRFFLKRGVDSTTAAIAETISAHSVQAAPAALVKTVTAAAVAKGVTASTSTLTLIKGALKIMAWTKAKTAVVVIIGVVAATGTATVAVKKIASAKRLAIYEKIFAQPDARSMPSLESAPPTLILRPTRYPNMHQGIGGGHGKCIHDGMKLSELIAWAYGGDPTRVILPGDAPTGYFDYLNTLPSRQNEALREKIKTQFGLVAKREMRPTDVLLLEARNPYRLASFRTKGGPFACYTTGRGDIETRCFTNAPLSLFAEQDVEGYFEKPCILRTDPKAKYDFAFQWTEPKGLSGEARRKALRPVMEEQIRQLGLELVPTNMPLEMLVVEKSN